MFLLPNKNKIDADAVKEAMKDGDENSRYFLDTTTGHVGHAGGVRYRAKLKRLQNNSRYRAIPKVTQEQWNLWLKDFAEMIGTMDMDGSVLRKMILEELARGGDVLTRCRALMEERKETDGWIHGWAQYESDALWEELTAWFGTLPFEIIDDWELDEDCELCALLKKENHTLGDWSEAAQKEARKKCRT